MGKITKDTFIVLFNVAVQFFIILIYLIFAITLNQWGLIVGGALGLFASTLNIFLIIKGSSSLLTITESNFGENGQGKVKSRKGQFVIFFFIRFVVTIGLLVLTVLLQYKANVTAFNFSFIPLIISLTLIVPIIPIGGLLYTRFKIKKKVDTIVKNVETFENKIKQIGEGEPVEAEIINEEDSAIKENRQ